MSRGVIALIAALSIVAVTAHVDPLAAQQPQPAAPAGAPAGQAGPPRPRIPSAGPFKKRILVVGAATGWQHDSIPDAMASVWKLGKENGMWDTHIRTDYQAITKKPAGPTGAGINGKNLDYFDAVVFANATGEMALDDEQKAALLSFVKDDGKGFVGIHAALDANYKWPEFAELIGGWFDMHPWNTFDAPIVVEDATFPAVRHFPARFMRRDEIYQAKQWSRDKVNVLLRLDETKLNYENNPNIKRTDRDFAVAWSKMYGKGRVFYSTLGHTNEAWQDPDILKMYEEAIKWVLGVSEGSTESHPRPTK